MDSSAWNRKASVYHLWRQLPPFRQILKHEINNCRRLLHNIPVPTTVLDLGSGVGSTWSIFPEATTKIALDRSHVMIGKIRKHKNTIPVVGDATCLPVKKECIQNISAVGLSEYIADKKAWLKKVYLCLKPGGHLLVTISPPGIFNRLRNILGNRIYTIGTKNWEQIISHAEFDIVDTAQSLLQYQYLLLKSDRTNA